MLEDNLKGYKAFYYEDNKLLDRFDNVYEVGKTYHFDDDNIMFHKNGYHFCKNPEDTLRYFDGFERNVVIAEVTGFGNYHEYWDDYYEYYDMYAIENITINRIVEMEELLSVIKNKIFLQKGRFIKGIKLKDSELDYLVSDIKYIPFERQYLENCIKYNKDRQEEINSKKGFKK